MSARPERLLRHIRRLVRGPDPEFGTNCTSDAALLQCFVEQRDEEAFAALLARHAPMVLGVCGRMLGNRHDAEDAAQAVFLVLARRASTIRPPHRLASWLYGVARHVAWKSLRTDARRRRRQLGDSRNAIRPEPPDPLDELSGRELLAVLDEELDRLPEAYRLAVLLCGVEGLSQEEAARRLGWTPGSVRGRLERGRARLHARLLRRGLSLSAVLGAAEVGRASAAALPAALGLPTVRAAVAFTGGAGSAVPEISSEVLALAHKGLQAMYLWKWKVALVLLVVSGVTGPGVAWLTRGPGATRPAVAAAEPGKEPPAAKSRAEAIDKARTALQKITEQAREEDMALTERVVRARQRQVELEEQLREAEAQKSSPDAPNPTELRLRTEEMQLREEIAVQKERVVAENEPTIKRSEAKLEQVRQRLRRFEAERKDERAARVHRLIQLRQEMVRLEEDIRLLERERALRRDEADRRRDAAAERVRQLEGIGPAVKEQRPLRSVERKLDALQREVSELRREIQRLQRDKKP
jgi:RNA polymerase sigma factor (sigma-70 family)